jgi:hypothetical protein
MRGKCSAIFSGRRAPSDSRLNLPPSNTSARTALGPSSICAKPWPGRESIPSRQPIPSCRWTTTCPIRSKSRVSPKHCTTAARGNKRAARNDPICGGDCLGGALTPICLVSFQPPNPASVQAGDCAYLAAVCRSIPSALAMAYGVSPFFARCTIFWRISIPSFGRPIFMPLAFARAIPALVRSLTFCASNFANDESNARSMFRTSSLSVARCGSV